MPSSDVYGDGFFPLHPPVVIPFAQSLCAISFLAVLLVVVSLFSSPGATKDKDNYPVALPKSWIFTAWPFFRRRFDFLNAGFRETGQALFKFSLLQHTVIAVSGEAAREAFCKTRDFDINQGFAMLSGAIPMLRGVTADLQQRRVALIHRRLLNMQRDGSLSRLIIEILGDTRQIMDSWGKSGSFDPFVTIYNLLFQTTIRALTCHEIADRPDVVKRLREQYEILDSGTTPATVLIPWFPTFAMIKKWLATLKVYDILVNAVNERERSGTSHDDTLQMLLDCKDERLVIIGFCMGLIVAGARSTGTAATWLLIYLGSNPEWKAKVIAEIEELMANRSVPREPNSSLSTRLASIPLECWESETPVLDSLIRETLRVAQPHTAMRRNNGPDVCIGGKVIPAGSYVVYPFSDIHLNEEYHPDPWRFDPGRSHNSKVWMGWGRGHITCLGNRLAQVELKLITSVMLLGFRHIVVDKSGEEPSSTFHPDWNDYLGCRPSTGPVFIKFERTGVPL